MNNSWPEPWNSDGQFAGEQPPPGRRRARRPTRPAPQSGPRRGTPVVAASTMPTIRPASITSRKTMSSAESIRSYCAITTPCGGGGMIFAHEGIFARRQGAQADIAAGIARHHFFDLQGGGIEFLGGGVLVGQRDHRGRVGLHMNHGGREFVVLQRHRDRRHRPRRGRRADKRRQGGNQKLSSFGLARIGEGPAHVDRLPPVGHARGLVDMADEAVARAAAR